jgi:putative peptidoglycan lipid II flippase
VIGTAVGTAMLPMLSRQVRGGEADASRATLNRALEYALFLTLPAAVALGVAAFPIMSVLFGRGAFDAESAWLSAQALMAYAIGLPAFVIVKVLAPGFFARGDTKTPVRIGIAAVLLNLALNLVLMVPLRHVGPALATSLASVFNVVWLAIALHRRGFLQFDAQLRRRLPRMLLAAAAMGLVLYAAQHPLFTAAAGAHGLRWGALALLVMLGLAAYALGGQALGAFDLREARRLVTRQRAAVPAVRS